MYRCVVAVAVDQSFGGAPDVCFIHYGSFSTVSNFEAERNTPCPNNLTAIQRALETAGVEFIPENCGGGWGADAEGLGACTGADTPHGKRNGNHKVVVFALPAEDTRPLVGEGRLEIRKFCF